MRNIINSFLVIILLAGCTEEENILQLTENFVDKVTICSKPFEFENESTRTVLTNTGSKISFGWRDGESIGIFPVAPTSNIQAKQVLGMSENSSKATFEGAGWALKRGHTYAAYSPFNPNITADVTYDEVPIDMTEQTQNGNNNLNHIGNGYDFMYAKASVPTENGVNFEFNHACAIIMMELTMPEVGKWENVTLTADSEVFITKATINISNGNIIAKEKSKSISLGLNDISTNDANQKLALYLAVLPTITGVFNIAIYNYAGKKNILLLLNPRL